MVVVVYELKWVSGAHAYIGRDSQIDIKSNMLLFLSNKRRKKLDLQTNGRVERLRELWGSQLTRAIV